MRLSGWGMRSLSQGLGPPPGMPDLGFPPRSRPGSFCPAPSDFQPRVGATSFPWAPEPGSSVPMHVSHPLPPHRLGLGLPGPSLAAASLHKKHRRPAASVLPCVLAHAPRPPFLWCVVEDRSPSATSVCAAAETGAAPSDLLATVVPEPGNCIFCDMSTIWEELPRGWGHRETGFVLISPH